MPLIGTCRIICVEPYFGKHLRRANNFFGFLIIVL